MHTSYRFVERPASRSPHEAPRVPSLLLDLTRSVSGDEHCPGEWIGHLFLED